MRWTRGYQSDDVEVRKGGSAGGFGGGGGGSGLLGGILSLVVSRFGIVGGIVVLGLFLVLNGTFSKSSSSAADSTATEVTEKKSDERVQFASFVLDDIQKTWARKFADRKGNYAHTRLVIFQNGTSTGCGYGQSATGPFYCPRDRQVYLDLDFFKTLEQRLGARGDFAQAYVIAHEVGHHVQNQLGLTDKVHEAAHAEGANGLSVRTELQADCFAGIWAHDTANRDLLEKGDIEEALNAASSIGDDRLQKMGRGTVQPESWTHGSSAQRVHWFKRGYDSGEIDSCDTSQSASL